MIFTIVYVHSSHELTMLFKKTTQWLLLKVEYWGKVIENKQEKDLKITRNENKIRYLYYIYLFYNKNIILYILSMLKLMAINHNFWPFFVFYFVFIFHIVNAMVVDIELLQNLTHRQKLKTVFVKSSKTILFSQETSMTVFSSVLLMKMQITLFTLWVYW